MHALSTLRPIVSVSGQLLFCKGPLQELDAAQQFPRPGRVALSGKAFKVAVSNRQRGRERKVILFFVGIGSSFVCELVAAA